MNLLDRSYLGSSTATWVGALGALLLARLVLGAVRHALLARLKTVASRTTNRLDDLVVSVLSQTRPFFLWACALQVGALVLALPARFERAARIVVVVSLLLQVGLWASALVRELSARYVTGLEGDAESAAQRGARETAASTAGFVLRVVLWTALVLMLLDNLGVNISALVAGLGVGGVAVALAVQNILGDLFGSITIALDKPFVVGDFIIVDDFMGTVEHVGLKTTRLRSLHGELLVFANADLLRARIKNYKHLTERRVAFGFGVTYQTSPAQLEELPGVVRAIIEAREGVRFDRAHFKTLGASSLDFEVVYHVLDPEFGTYLDHQQAINLAIMRALAARSVEFAYPTQTLFLARAA